MCRPSVLFTTTLIRSIIVGINLLYSCLNQGHIEFTALNPITLLCYLRLQYMIKLCMVTCWMLIGIYEKGMSSTFDQRHTRLYCKIEVFEIECSLLEHVCNIHHYLYNRDRSYNGDVKRSHSLFNCLCQSVKPWGLLKSSVLMYQKTSYTLKQT